MVSNARLDLPEPESPVTTTSLSRGISTEMFLRLCTRAPWTAMVVRAAALPEVFFLPIDLEAIRSVLKVEERQLLHFDVALLGELHQRRGFADEFLVGQVLACRGDAAEIEVPPEVVFDLRARPRFADIAEVIDHWGEQRPSTLGQVSVDRVERSLDVFPGLLGVEQVDVDRLEQRGVELQGLGDHVA